MYKYLHKYLLYIIKLKNEVPTVITSLFVEYGYLNKPDYRYIIDYKILIDVA
jgi:hypothetical protein